jgi:hypothetical protein
MTDIRPTLRQDNTGSVYMRDKDNKEFLLNPRALTRSDITTKRNPRKDSKNHDFKLVTVRKLTNFSIEEVQAQIEAQKTRVNAAAIRSGFSVSFPSPIVLSENDLNQTYGVFIDEDLYGIQKPVYIYKSPSTLCQWYVIATGEGKDDWIITGCHSVSKKTTPDGSFTQQWRIYHIDNSTPDTATRLDYVLDSSALSSYFEFNFDISNLKYLGGGTWSASHINPLDRIPVFSNVKPYLQSEYIVAGNEFQGTGNSCIVAYSITPSSSFTWNRGSLKLNERVREFNQKTDLNEFLSSGVIKTTRTHSYQLDLTYRVENGDIQEVNRQEYSKGSATYVGNTNYKVNSPFQSPDYGTDAARLSISSISMDTNVIRPAKATGIPIPILCSSFNSSNYISIELGSALGEINHPFEIQTSAGSRGYDYSDYYKFWFSYGKVLSITPYGDTKRYSLAKSTGIKAQIGEMLDLGQIYQDRNKVVTTWDSLPNPQTGFFNIVSGRLQFLIQYLNPPLMGHDGVYYYELNPFNVGASGAYYDRSFGSDSAMELAGYTGGSITGGGLGNDELSRQQSNQLLYSEMIGALGGGALQSINIGMVNIGVNDGESVIVREPTPNMKADLVNTPHLFPNGFWDADLLDVTISTNNECLATSYDEEGTIVKTWKF